MAMSNFELKASDLSDCHWSTSNQYDAIGVDIIPPFLSASKDFGGMAPAI
jgi:hypothetical protein